MHVFRKSLAPFVRTHACAVATVLVAILAMSTSAHAGIAPPTYTLQDLAGSVPASTFTGVQALNDKGVAAGIVYGNIQQAAIFGNGSVQYLGDLGGTLSTISESQAYGINALGQVVGSAQVPGGQLRGFLYSGSTMCELGALAYATGINNAGQVVGNATVNGSDSAFIYSNGILEPISASNAKSTDAAAINNKGQVVGAITLANSNVLSPFIYWDGAFTILKGFGGNLNGADAINDAGQVAGSSETASGAAHAFLYSDGTMLDLGTLGGTDSYANGISNSGEVVGYSHVQTGPIQASLYTDGTMYDVNNLVTNPHGYVIEDATAINSNGQIVASAVSPQGSYRAVLLTPTSVSLLPAVWAALSALPLMLLSKRFRRNFTLARISSSERYIH